MFRVPTPMIAALNSVTKRRVRLEWSNDRFLTVGGTLDVYNSQFDCDALSLVRWAATCSAIDVDSRVNHITTWVRAFLEVKGMRVQWWTVPMGVYRVSGMKINGRYTDFELDGLESVVRDYRFHVPRSLPLQPTDSPETTLRKLILETIPNATVTWLIKTSQATMNPVTFDRDRWAAIDGDATSKSICGAYAADCYVNRVGHFVAEATTITTTSEPVWTITVDKGVKVSSSTELSRENMRNVWTIWAAPSNAPVIGPVHVWDNDPGSKTYAGPNPRLYGAIGSAAFGIVPGYYQSPILRDVRACAMVGYKRLSLSLSPRRNVTITSIFNPTLDAGDCVALVPDGSTNLEKFIVEKVGYRMDDASTQLTLRAQGPIAMAESDEGVILEDPVGVT